MNLKLVLIKELIEGVLSNMNKNEELVVNYYDPKEENERINQSIISEVKRKSFKEGIEQKEKEIVLNMYKENFSLEMISKISKLSVDEINKIINSDSNK